MRAVAAVLLAILGSAALLMSWQEPSTSRPLPGQPDPSRVRAMPGQPDPAKMPAPQSPAAAPAPGTPLSEGGDDQYRLPVTVNIIIAPTTVMDRDGSFVPGLRASDFQLTDNDKLQDIRVDEAFYPISLVVCVQANNMMETMLPRVREIGPMLQGLLTGDQGEVAVVSFDHQIRVQQDFTTDGEKIKEGLAKIRPGSSSARNVDVIEHASRMLSHRPKDHRRIILLIAETRGNGNEGKLRDALLAAQIQNVVIYTINVNRFVTKLMTQTPPPRPDPMPAAAHAPMPGGAAQTPGNVAAMTGLQGNSIQFMPLFVEIFKDVKAIFVDSSAEVFTKFTGGVEYGYTTRKDLEHAVQRISSEIHSQYLLSYNPNNKIEGGWHDIKVTVRRPDLQVRTRKGYWLAARPE